MCEESDSSRSLSDPRTWLHKYGDYLYSYIVKRTGDTVVAQDIIQETLLSALKARYTFKGNATERTWLTSICRHKILDHIRKEINRSSDLDDELGGAKQYFQEGKWEGHWTIRTSPREWGRNPQAVLESKQFWEVLEECLKKLPKLHRAVFTLYEMDEMETPEICKELGITSTNLWVILHRCRRRLRSCLEENWFKEGQK